LYCSFRGQCFYYRPRALLRSVRSMTLKTYK
jgi:hypothetical protein